MANTPKVAQYKAYSSPMTNAATGATVWPGGSQQERWLLCLAVYLTQTNPDGTVRGT